jgi:hypothetical protein
MPTLAELRKQNITESFSTSRTSNPEVLVSDIRNRMRSTEIIERKLQAALFSRGSAEPSDKQHAT